MILEFDPNFTPTSIAALPGMKSQTIFHSIGKPGQATDESSLRSRRRRRDLSVRGPLAKRRQSTVRATATVVAVSSSAFAC